MEILQQYVVVITAAFSLVVVQIVKPFLPEAVQTKFLPAFAAILGLAFNIFVANFEITPLVIVEGLVSGLAGTGLYEIIKDIANK